MRTFIVSVLVTIVGLGIAGFALGWFKVFTSPNEQLTNITLSVDRDKVKKDRDATGEETGRDQFLARSETRFKAMDLNLVQLKAKAKAKNGLAVTKEKMDQAIGELNAKTEAARDVLQELKTATPQQWDALKAHFSGAMHEVEAAYEKVFSRFMNEWTLSS